ncbi:ead/Ea22-like family protein [Citrobacter braakii]|uniref:ead/Ea22-like family protein n=1 Tax=Citrobacter braakii TaxID=57706 RepID=UPI0037B32405
MTALNKQALRDSALDIIRVLGYIASFESEDIDGDDLELRFETEDGLDTGCTISITSQCQDASDVMRQLLNELEAAEKRIAEQSEIVAAAEKLVRCKGRYHSELNYRALAKLFGVTTPDLPPLKHENVHYADAAEMEIAALRQRIAELEARTVNLPKLRVSEVMLVSGFSRDYAEGWCAGNDNAIHEIRATGIGVKGE